MQPSPRSRSTVQKLWLWLPALLLLSSGCETPSQLPAVPPTFKVPPLPNSARQLPLSETPSDRALRDIESLEQELRSKLPKPSGAAASASAGTTR